MPANRTTESENHNFADATAMINSGQKYQWILKLMGETRKRNKFYMVLTHLPVNYTLTMEGEKATLRQRKLQTFWKWSGATTTSKSTNRHLSAPGGMGWEQSIPSVMCWLQCTTWGSMSERADKATLRDGLQNGWPISFKRFKVIKVKETQE